MPSTVKDIVRDFTEEMIEILKNDIENNAAGTKERYTNYLIILSTDDKMKRYMTRYSLFKINEFIDQIDVEKAEALERLYDVFRDVNGIDVKYRIKINSISDQLICYKRTLSDLASLIQPDATGECPFTSPGFMARLEKIGSPVFDYWIDQLLPKTMNNGKADIEPDWDTIEEWFRTPPDELTAAQLAALGAAYLMLSNDEDAAKFLSCGYVRDASGLPTVAYTLSDTMHVVNYIVEDLALSRTLDAVCTQNVTGAIGEADKMMFERMQMMQIVCTSAKTIGWNYTEHPGADIGAFPKKTNLVRISREYGFKNTKCEDCKAYLENKCEESQACEKSLVLTTTSHVSFPDTEHSPTVTMKIRVGKDGTKMQDGAELDRSVTENYILAQVGSMSDNVLKILANEALGMVTGGSAILGLALGPGRSIYNEYVEQMRSISEAKSYWGANEMATGLNYLETQINFSEVGGKIVVHTIRFDTVTGMERTEGFLNYFNNKKDFGFKISVDEFRLITLNGMPPEDQKLHRAWKELGPEVTSLNRAQQLLVYDEYVKYLDRKKNGEKNDSNE